MKWLAAALAVTVAACSAAVPTSTPAISPTPPPTVAPTAAVTPSPGPTAVPTIGPLVEGALPADAADALFGVLDGYIASELATSISAAVIVPGVGTWSGAAGRADREGEVAATPDTVYALGSITKTYVAALILRLAEDGFLSLDDPAADHLGPVAGAKTNGATVRQLLGHRSGIDNYTDHPVIFEDRPWTPAEVLEVVGDRHFAPGEQFEYSNTNYLLLGLIAEVVTGGPLADLLHEYLLSPLDMSRTYYGAAEAADEPVAHGYVALRDELRDVYDGSGRLPNANTVSAAVGAGSMAATAADVAHWLYWLFAGHVLDDESLSEMLDFGASITYGLGVMRYAQPGAGQVIGHSGSIPGFGSAGYVARDSGVVVVVLSNSETLDFDGVLRRLFDAVQAAAPQT